jgi:hypothetical protein
MHIPELLGFFDTPSLICVYLRYLRTKRIGMVTMLMLVFSYCPGIIQGHRYA